VSTVRVYFADERVGQKFKRSTFRQGERVLEAIRAASQDAADEMVEQGNANIAGAGNFGSRWQTLKAPVTEGGGQIAIRLTHPIPYFMVHQRGATIRGKPLLWIPLPGAPNFPRGRGNTFFQRSRKGNLLLFGKRGKEIFPLRVAKKSVRIPKRFRVIEIARDIARNMREFYLRRWNNG
jgi:hypothetical protein